MTRLSGDSFASALSGPPYTSPPVAPPLEFQRRNKFPWWRGSALYGLKLYSALLTGRYSRYLVFVCSLFSSQNCSRGGDRAMFHTLSPMRSFWSLFLGNFPLSPMFFSAQFSAFFLPLLSPLTYRDPSSRFCPPLHDRSFGTDV